MNHVSIPPPAGAAAPPPPPRSRGLRVHTGDLLCLLTSPRPPHRISFAFHISICLLRSAHTHTHFSGCSDFTLVPTCGNQSLNTPPLLLLPLLHPLLLPHALSCVPASPLTGVSETGAASPRLLVSAPPLRLLPWKLERLFEELPHVSVSFEDAFVSAFSGSSICSCSRHLECSSAAQQEPDVLSVSRCVLKTLLIRPKIEGQKETFCIKEELKAQQKRA